MLLFAFHAVCLLSMKEDHRIHPLNLVFVIGSMQLAKGHHDKCSSHASAMVIWSQYKLNAKHTSIADRLESNRAQIISTNWHYLKSLIQILLLCAQQEITLRGHREGSTVADLAMVPWVPWNPPLGQLAYNIHTSSSFITEAAQSYKFDRLQATSLTLW